jgi:hypothetical protein
MSAIMFAIQHKTKSINDISVQINAISKDGMNDVHRAIIAGKEQTLSILACGGNPNLSMSNGTLPVTLVMKYKFNMAKMFCILVKNGPELVVIICK